MYWGNREKSRETFQGGWTKSGDKYVRDADGYYTYSGRSDDMLKVSGIWVSPFEVEATLMQHPAVLECAVIGTEDGEGLTKTKAFVVVKPGAAVSDGELKAFVKEKLAAYKYPRAIEFVDELPKTATGKIQRFRLRERERAGASRRERAALAGRARRRGSTGAAAPLEIEHEWVGAPRGAAPVVVFLHEGLGSISMWKDFPREFCEAHGFTGFVFSRYGYGRSTAKPRDERWAPDFMHRQADEVLPALFAAVGIERPWLFGHSDGALDRAAARGAPSGRPASSRSRRICSSRTSRSRASRRRASPTRRPTCARRLARHHADPDSAFRGWNDAWLSPAFRDWNIEARDRARSPARCSPSRARTTSTARSRRFAPSRVACRRTALLVLARLRPLAAPRPARAPLARAAGRFILETRQAICTSVQPSVNLT